MATHAVFTDFTETFFKTRIAARRALITKLKKKQKMLLFLNDEGQINPYETLLSHIKWQNITIGNAETLCQQLAYLNAQIAAIIILSQQASNFYFRKAREMASALDAYLIWDIDTIPNIALYRQADVLLQASPNLPTAAIMLERSRC